MAITQPNSSNLSSFKCFVQKLRSSLKISTTINCFWPLFVAMEFQCLYHLFWREDSASCIQLYSSFWSIWLSLSFDSHFWFFDYLIIVFLTVEICSLSWCFFLVDFRLIWDHDCVFTCILGIGFSFWWELGFVDSWMRSHSVVGRGCLLVIDLLFGLHCCSLLIIRLGILGPDVIASVLRSRNY